MSCYHPLRAWRTRAGHVQIAKELPDSTPLAVPCGGCLGCRTARAKEWALRCHLEFQQHHNAAFTTLTYNSKSLPPTLDKTHLSKFIKRLRKKMGAARPLRFFACGEYGEQGGRPHYHAILYGASHHDRNLIEDTWGLGNTRTEKLTPARIAYAAGYTSTKIGYRREAAHERVDPTTGEVYRWQPPFLQMSRNPGIGGDSRKHPHAWRLFAVHNGVRQPVPRFLHEAWKQQATQEEKEQLAYEKSLITLTRDKSPERLKAQEQIQIKKQELQGSRRHLE